MSSFCWLYEQTLTELPSVECGGTVARASAFGLKGFDLIPTPVIGFS